jgi:two-component system chemotaxis response regulator CheB
MARRESLTPGQLLPDPNPTEVLIVDDSAVVRQRLKTIVESDPRFRVVLAADPYEAVERLKKSVPGVIVLDVEMPRMDGLTFLRKLMRQHPMPVVLCTSQAERAVTALEMGAMEVIAKPDWNDANRLSDWSQGLLESIRNAVRAGRLPFGEDRPAVATDARHKADAVLPKLAYSPRAGASDRIIVVGISTGGVQALKPLLAGFPIESPGIVIVQHMPAEFTGTFAQRLNDDPRIPIEVGEARQHEPIRSGRALIMPGGEMHGIIRRSGAGYRVELVDGPPVCRHRPSVEVLFRSAAQAGGPFAAGVIMTGMGDDGASGLLEMREAGALTIAQNEATCKVFGMPQEAIRRGAARFVTPLDSIAPTIIAWVANPDSGSWH